MITYYDVYNFDGQLVDCYDYEWQADQVAKEYNGYYLERNEKISLQGLTNSSEYGNIIMSQGKGDKTLRSLGSVQPLERVKIGSDPSGKAQVAEISL